MNFRLRKIPPCENLSKHFRRKLQFVGRYIHEERAADRMVLSAAACLLYFLEYMD